MNRVLMIAILGAASFGASANGPQFGTVEFRTNTGSFLLACELDYSISTPDEQYVGMVCDDPNSFLQADLTVGDSDYYSIEDRDDGQLYLWTCARKGRISISHGEFLAVADCRSSLGKAQR